MPTEKTCPTCGKPLTDNALMGLCPDCLLQAGLGTIDTRGEAAEKSAPFVPPTPEELARYFPELEIIELLGRGGMGAVYKVRQKRLERRVALKILPPYVDQDASFAERFEREAKALAQLHHPNIVTLYDSGQVDGLFYFFMEFVDGVNLRQLLDTGHISPKEALAIVPQICDALQFAHDRGIIHRDIKPENILLNKEGRVKIADFGVAKIVARELPEAHGSGAPAPQGEQTEAGKVIGTPQYMAPEQLSHPLDVDSRADIYALGGVFYQMLTGELPAGKFEPPSSKVQIDVRLDEIVLRALQKQPELRYQTVGEFRTQVETIAGSPGEATPTPPGYQLLHSAGFTTFRSLTAVRFAQLSCAGFLGFLGYIPGWERLFGLFGLFGFIGIAYLIEVMARSKADPGQPIFAPGLNNSRTKILLWSVVLAVAAIVMALNVTPIGYGLAIGIWGVLLTLISIALALLAGRDMGKIKLAGQIVTLNGIGIACAAIWCAFHSPTLPGVWTFAITLACLGGIAYGLLGLVKWTNLKPPTTEIKNPTTPVILSAPKGSGWGIAALILCLGAIPMALLCDILGHGNWAMVAGVAVALEVVALVIGIVGWRSTPGKIAVIFSGLLLLASIPVGVMVAVLTRRSETMHYLVQRETQKQAAAVAFKQMWAEHQWQREISRQLQSRSERFDDISMGFDWGTNTGTFTFSKLQEMKGINGQNVWIPIDGTLIAHDNGNGAWQVQGIGQLGAVQFTVTGPDTDTPATLPHTFGPETKGLQTALELRPTDNTFTLDSSIEVLFYLRNISTKNIFLAGGSWRQDDATALTITGEQGRKIPVIHIWYSGETPIQRTLLAPGETTAFHSSGLAFLSEDADEKKVTHPVGNYVKVKPGRYTIAYRLHFPDLFQGKAPEEEDWQGDLETAPVTVNIEAPATSSSSQNPSFGPVIERELSANDTLTNAFLDLDTGEVLSPPKELLDSIRAKGRLYGGRPKPGTSVSG